MMPRGDGTGPEGQGSATGRGLGYCTGYSSPGFTKGAPRGGAGRGGGRGRRRGAGRQSAYNPRGQPRPRFAASNVPSGSADVSQTEIQDPAYESLMDKVEELEEEVGELRDQLD